MKFLEKWLGQAKKTVKAPTEEEAFVAWIQAGIESPLLHKNQNGGHIIFPKSMMSRLEGNLRRNNYFLQHTLRYEESTAGAHMFHFTVAPGQYPDELPSVIAEKVWEDIEKTIFAEILACEDTKQVRQSMGCHDVNFDHVIYTIYALDEADRYASTLMWHPHTERSLRLLKNGDGDYMWPIDQDDDDMFGYSTDEVEYLPRGTILFADYHHEVKVRIGSVFAKREDANGEVVLRCSLPVTVYIDNPETFAIFNG